MDGPHINALTFLGSPLANAWAPPDRVTCWLEGNFFLKLSAERLGAVSSPAIIAPFFLVLASS